MKALRYSLALAVGLLIWSFGALDHGALKQAEAAAMPAMGPPNDNCVDAVEIFAGPTGFSNVGATPDGMAHRSCKFGGQGNNDIWFSYTATCDELLTVSTCNSADYDTNLFVYQNTNFCPPGDSALVGCNDDGFGCAGFTSQVTVPVVAGNSYLIRVGSFNVTGTGDGTLTLTCGGPPPAIIDHLTTCDEPNGTTVEFGSADVPAIQPNAFAPNSDLFTGVVQFRDAPISFGDFGDADTLVLRGSDPIILGDPIGTENGTQIQITALSLVSSNPITVTFFGGLDPEFWDVRVTLSDIHPQPIGSMVAFKTHDNGGVFQSDLPVNPLFIFTRVDDPPGQLVVDPANEGAPPWQLQSGPAPWVSELDPAIKIVEPGPLRSSFIPGVEETNPGDPSSQEIVPMTATTFSGGVTHTVCPAQAPIPVSSIQVDQLDWFATDGTPLAVDSDDGMIGIEVPNLEGQVAFINAEVDGVWRVQNMPISSIDFAIDAPTETYWTIFEIGPDGVDVILVDVRVFVAPFRLPTGIPPEVPVLTVPVGSFSQQLGSEESLIPAVPIAVPSDGPPAEGAASQIESASRPGFNMVDLDENDDKNACAAGAIASSFVWLNRTYCLGQPEGKTPADTKNTVLDEMKQRLGTTKEDGTAYDDIMPGKAAYIRKHKLPITVDGQGRGSPNTGTAVDAEELFQQMKQGEDVELSIRWGGDDSEDHGHAIAIVAMTKEVREDGTIVYTMTRLDDGDQDAAGSNDRRLEGRLEHRDTNDDGTPDTWFYTYTFANGNVKTSKIVGWRSESPTQAAINRAIAEKATALGGVIDDLGGTADSGQAADLLKRVCHLQFLADRLKNRVDRNPSSTDAQKTKARELADAAATLKRLAQEVSGMVGNPDQADALAELGAQAQALKDCSDALRAMYPPDKDYDDIPDDDDNAPNDANPDQADCNGDGIGDVSQLEDNDANDNAIPDDCEKAEVCNPACVWDIDNSGDVRVPDLIKLLSCWGPIVLTSDPVCACLDIDNSGDIRVPDLIAMLAQWGTCP